MTAVCQYQEFTLQHYLSLCQGVVSLSSLVSLVSAGHAPLLPARGSMRRPGSPDVANIVQQAASGVIRAVTHTETLHKSIRIVRFTGKSGGACSPCNPHAVLTAMICWHHYHRDGQEVEAAASACRLYDVRPTCFQGGSGHSDTWSFCM